MIDTKIDIISLNLSSLKKKEILLNFSLIRYTKILFNKSYKNFKVEFFLKFNFYCTIAHQGA